MKRTERTSGELLGLLVYRPQALAGVSQQRGPLIFSTKSKEPHLHLLALAFGLTRLLVVGSAKLEMGPLASQNVLSCRILRLESNEVFVASSPGYQFRGALWPSELRMSTS